MLRGRGAYLSFRLHPTRVAPAPESQLLRRAGVRGVRFHDLRHTCATLLLTKGVHPKIVSEMLGHSSIAITLDIYSHVIPGMQEAAVGAMEDALGDDLGVNGGDNENPPVTSADDCISDCITWTSGQVPGHSDLILSESNIARIVGALRIADGAQS